MRNRIIAEDIVEQFVRQLIQPKIMGDSIGMISH